ncbi:SDR family oxidoreductase [Saccharopolyspora gloriosae]|uniref:SDR family oxidoreductase n=1 Tax=Saccharopolyspora gloriosae TaxID=455344 RepID=UPI001FB835C2|nr:SDR family oxidoreductase [Saccharopolyspora gloriosae]
MGTYAVTGSASGMGSATAGKLRAAGHTVVGVDLANADLVADLSTADGRRTAAEGVLAAVGGRLDGAVLAAGVGPVPGREAVIPQVNYFGAIELLRRWRPALAAAGNAKVVVLSSNSTTTTPLVPRRAVRALLSGDPDRAVRGARVFGKAARAIIYSGSKIALSRWVRRTAVLPEWAGSGIRLNALAPGAILTPIFPVPIGGYGDPSQLADWVVFMLSDAADFLVGSVVFVDDGSDAYFRFDAWPRPVPLRGLTRYLRRMRSFGTF